MQRFHSDRESVDGSKSWTYVGNYITRGFSSIESAQSLDVVAVYTAGKTGVDSGVSSIDVEYIRERRLR